MAGLAQARRFPETVSAVARYADVSLPSRVVQSFLYRVPDTLATVVKVGNPVLVDMRGGRRVGFVEHVYAEHPQPNSRFVIKDIVASIDGSTLFPQAIWEEVLFLSTYYLAPFGQVVRSYLPPGADFVYQDDKLMLKGPEPKDSRYIATGKPMQGVRHGEKARSVLAHVEQHPSCLRSELLEVYPDAGSTLQSLVRSGYLSVSKEDKQIRVGTYQTVAHASEPARTLHEHQEKAVAAVTSSIENKSFQVFLLHGVTGSGKTEVYLRLIAETIARGRSAIVLLPEISLTPQFLDIFFRRFGEQVAVMHSKLSASQKYAQWKYMREGRYTICIGARSALFSPFENIGLIVVDEEHEKSYKQESLLLYNAKDFAVVKGKFHGAPVVLGSATPAIESYYHAKQEKFTLLSMPERVGTSKLPTVDIVDLKTEPLAERQILLTERLLREIDLRLERREKTILFINRRGYSSCTMCMKCGASLKCQNCSIALKFHTASKALICHYCGYQCAFPEVCPACKQASLANIGMGTQKVEQVIAKLRPQARILRIDTDTTGAKDSHEEAYRALRGSGVDIIIGTQMIAKGLDIPDITLIGVLFPDVDLHFPDFRANERVFQMLTQVAGRAGRGDKPGHVIIQTCNPTSFALQQAATQDYVGFYEQEVETRRELGYPPFSRIHCFRLKGKNLEPIETAARNLGFLARAIIQKQGLEGDLRVLGPIVSPLEQINGEYRHQMLVKGERVSVLQHFSRVAQQVFAERYAGGGVQLSVDVDPLNFL